MTRAEVLTGNLMHLLGYIDEGNKVFAFGDELARKLTGSSLNELLDAADHGYVPTLRGGEEAEMLADIYDHAQSRRGRNVKAWRGLQGKEV